MCPPFQKFRSLQVLSETIQTTCQTQPANVHELPVVVLQFGKSARLEYLQCLRTLVLDQTNQDKQQWLDCLQHMLLEIPNVCDDGRRPNGIRLTGKASEALFIL